MLASLEREGDEAGAKPQNGTSKYYLIREVSSFLTKCPGFVFPLYTKEAKPLFSKVTSCIMYFNAKVFKLHACSIGYP